MGSQQKNLQNREEKQSPKIKKCKKIRFERNREMKEIISEALLKVVMIVAAILIVIFTGFKSYDVISSELNSIHEGIEQTTEGILVHEEIQKQTQELFINDYVNRVNNIGEILKLQEDENLTATDLRKLADFEDISNIYIVNNQGLITQSSDLNSIGLDFYKEPELDTFIPLIESKENGYFCEFSRNAVITGKQMVYLMVRNDADKLIQIEIEPSVLQNYINGTSVLSYIEGIPTKWHRTILVMDSNTGELIGITKNNKQTIEGENLLEAFKKAVDRPQIVKVNGSWQLTMSKQVSDSLLLVAFSAMPNIIEDIVYNILIFSLLIFVLNLCVYCFIIKILNQLVLQDIINIYEDVKLFASGKEVDIRDASTKELSALVKQLRRLKEGLTNSGEQLQLAISVLGNGFTGYEYYADYNRLFYADNCLELAGFTEAELEEEVKAFFEQNRPDKEEKKNITTIVQFGNEKIFKVNRYVTYDSVYAIIEDITERERLKKKLLSSQEYAYIDELTQLNNRRKLEYVIQDMNNSILNPKGVMLLMDLDNFKRVNDEKGHIEGDVLLQKFSNLIRKNFRDSDLKVRLGGDEFVVFIPKFISEERLIQKINQFFESVRDELHQYYVEYNLSVSIGAVYMNSECKSFEAMYHYADSAMYVAKRNGKDGYYISKEYNGCTRKECID